MFSQKIPHIAWLNLLLYDRRFNQFFNAMKNIPASDEEDLIHIGRMTHHFDNLIFMKGMIDLELTK